MDHDFLISCFLKFRKHVAVLDVTDGREWTYDALWEAIERERKRLRAGAICPGRVLSIYGSLTAEYLVLIFACLIEGIVVNPISSRIPLDKAKALADSIGAFFVSGEKFEIESVVPLGSAIPRSIVNVASLLCSSGSSGIPKIIAHSLGAHAFAAMASQKTLPLGLDSRWLLNLPIYHVSGFSILFRCLIHGACLVLPDGKRSLMENMIRGSVSHVSLVGTQLRRFVDQLKADKKANLPKSVRALLVGGGPIEPQLITTAVMAGLPIHLTYGMTEAASQITTSERIIQTSSAYTCGKPLSGYDVKIGHDGEIFIHTPALFSGYLRTDGTLCAASISHGWFGTGDIGRIDAQGHIHIEGRKDRMFISGGENIHPEVIEGALERCPGIKRAVVVPVGDREFGQRPVAFVHMDCNHSLEVDEITRQLRLELPGYCVPTAFFDWPDHVSPEGNKISIDQFRNALPSR